MWSSFNIEDYKHCRFMAIQQLGNRQLGLSLLETVPASAEKKWVPYYHFSIIHNGKDAGYLNFRLGNAAMLTEYDGHIGYRVFPSFRGMGLAGKACEIVRPLIRQHHMSSVILTCHPDNIASRRTIEKLGAEFLEIKHFYGLSHDMDGVKCRYRWRI